MLKPMATILIVEDDALLQDALTGQLKQLNYGVCTATSVAQGMAVLQDQAVDGIILDLGLPDADGLDLLTWARTRIVGLPVLILTARDGIDDLLSLPLRSGNVRVDVVAPASEFTSGDGEPPPVAIISSR